VVAATSKSRPARLLKQNGMDYNGAERRIAEVEIGNIGKSLKGEEANEKKCGFSDRGEVKKGSDNGDNGDNGVNGVNGVNVVETGVQGGGEVQPLFGRKSSKGNGTASKGVVSMSRRCIIIRTDTELVRQEKV